MRELSLFSGAGGGLLATHHLLGWETLGYVEFDDYCQRVLRARIDDGYLTEAPIFGDIRAFLSDGYAASYTGLVDVVTAGFPCQAHSTAARGRQRADRDLWQETAEVIRIIRPRWVLLECTPRAFESDCLKLCASWLRTPHRRVRGWMVAYSDSEGQSRRAIDAQMARICSLSNWFAWTKNLAGIMGMDDGGSHRVDRIRALGNAQVPAVAACAWEMLSG